MKNNKIIKKIIKKYEINKAFTLVELIAVIVILALIIILIVPNALKTSDSIKISALESKKENILSAAVMYGTDREEMFDKFEGCITINENEGNNTIILNKSEPSNNCYRYTYIYVKELADTKYIKYDEDKIVVNPADSENNLNNDVIYIYKKNNRVYSIYINKDDVIEKEDDSDENIYGYIKKSNITFILNHIKIENNIKNLDINYGDFKNIEIIPDEHYYLESISCTGEISISDYITGVSASNKQNIKITNKEEDKPQTCTITGGFIEYDPIQEEVEKVSKTVTDKNLCGTKTVSKTITCCTTDQTDGHGKWCCYPNPKPHAKCPDYMGGYEKSGEKATIKVDDIVPASCTIEECPEGSVATEDDKCIINTCPTGKYDEKTNKCIEENEE